MKKFGKKVLSFLGRKCKDGIETIKYFLCYPVAKLMYGKRTIYLIAERGTDARDNGYYMYRYIRCEHSELECYYVIERDSIDYKKVAVYGNILQYGSLKHYLLFVAAKYKISTHIMGCSPNMLFYVKFNAKHKIPGRQIFLQHGITQNDLVGLYSQNTNLDIFICGAKPEYEYVCQNFHYRNGEVKYTGLARYDGLHNYEPKNQILLMPTWRVYLKNLGRKEFLDSQYYILWNQVLSDEKLMKCLDKYDMQLIFYPHYELQPFADCFVSTDSLIKIADFSHYDVQTLLKESKLLVTDFSSVFFDFAYMKKPCVYYQFDEDTFFANHYKKGYFDYREIGFGEVCTRKEELIDMLIDYIEHSCQMKEVYRRRSEEFFSLRDNQNCKRIFREIEAL